MELSFESPTMAEQLDSNMTIKRTFRPRLVVRFTAVLLSAVGSGQTIYLGSKAPYAPQQDTATYEAPPSGFTTVFTQIVARHGSRGLSSPTNDLAIYNMWLAAQSSGGLTKAGERMGVEVLDVIRANAILGYNVPGITAPGYGNLTLRGIAEHTQLAQRLASRVNPLLSNAVSATTHRQVIVSNSGVNRANDSANYFTKSLGTAVPGIAPFIVNSDALTAYPVNAPVAQAAGINRFLLYFHKLAAKTDLPSTSDAYLPVYQSSLDYQAYLAGDPTMTSKVSSVIYSAASRIMARAVTRRFSPRRSLTRSTVAPRIIRMREPSRSSPTIKSSRTKSRAMARRCWAIWWMPRMRFTRSTRSHRR